MSESSWAAGIEPSRTVSLRERARAVLSLALVMRDETGQVGAVEGSLELLARGNKEEDGLGALFRLSPVAEAVLTLSLAPDLAPELAPVFAALIGEGSRQRPSLDLALSLLTPDLPLDLGVVADLTSKGLLQVSPIGNEPLALADLVPSPSLVGHLLGAPRLPPGVVLATPDSSASQVSAGALTDRPDLIHVYGEDVDTLLRWAEDLSFAEARSLLLVHDTSDAALISSDLVRESVLRNALVCFENLSSESGIPDTTHLPRPLLHLSSHSVAPSIPGCQFVIPVHIEAPSAIRRAAIWHDLLPNHLISESDRLADRYRLSVSQIRGALEYARGLALSRGESELERADVEAGCRAQTGADLARLAPRVSVVPRWAHLVLPDDARTQLDELVSRVEARRRVVDEWGFGQRRTAHPTTALFVGPSGTGKTMAAEAVAERLGLPLHRIDLARVVSKYIGETEKQLDLIFDAASRTTAVLFFDEADALFGKRSEVRDAHDRYANLEVSYLLQRMENHDGIALLATNLGANLDEAFTRRIDFTIHFPFPQSQARRQLWQGAWPSETPVGDLDLDGIADEYELSGGSIRNVALASAYLAASNGGVVAQEHVVHAIGREYQKLGISMSDLDSQRTRP